MYDEVKDRQICSTILRDTIQLYFSKRVVITYIVCSNRSTGWRRMLQPSDNADATILTIVELAESINTLGRRQWSCIL